MNTWKLEGNNSVLVNESGEELARVWPFLQKDGTCAYTALPMTEYAQDFPYRHGAEQYAEAIATCEGDSPRETILEKQLVRSKFELGRLSGIVQSQNEKLGELRQALEVYANPAMYTNDPRYGVAQQLIADGGETARNALAGAK